jgi:hypothetical protein
LDVWFPDEIDDHMDAAVARLVQQLRKVAQRAQTGSMP